MERRTEQGSRRPPSPASLVKSLAGLRMPVNMELATPNFIPECLENRNPCSVGKNMGCGKKNRAPTSSGLLPHIDEESCIAPPVVRKTTTLRRKPRKEKKRFSLIEKRFGTHANKFVPTRTQKELLRDLKPKWQRASVPPKEVKIRRRKKRRESSLQSTLREFAKCGIKITGGARDEWCVNDKVDRMSSKPSKRARRKVKKKSMRPKPKQNRRRESYRSQTDFLSSRDAKHSLKPQRRSHRSSSTSKSRKAGKFVSLSTSNDHFSNRHRNVKSMSSLLIAKRNKTRSKTRVHKKTRRVVRNDDNSSLKENRMPERRKTTCHSLLFNSMSTKTKSRTGWISSKSSKNRGNRSSTLPRTRSSNIKKEVCSTFITSMFEETDELSGLNKSSLHENEVIEDHTDRNFSSSLLENTLCAPHGNLSSPPEKRETKNLINRFNTKKAGGTNGHRLDDLRSCSTLPNDEEEVDADGALTTSLFRTTKRNNIKKGTVLGASRAFPYAFKRHVWIAAPVLKKKQGLSKTSNSFNRVRQYSAHSIRGQNGRHNYGQRVRSGTNTRWSR